MNDKKIKSERGIYSLMLAFFLGTALMGCKEQEAYVLSTQQFDGEEVSQVAEMSAESVPAKVCVYVCGAVQSPGVYELKEGARIADAIEAAGGMTKKAQPDGFNLAEKLQDGQMIDVLTKKEAKERAQKNSMQTVEQDETSEDPDGKINLNSATKEELMRIPGIGETRAQSILSYRMEHGNFSRIEDIMCVEGIKEGLFERMKEYICAK